MFSHINITSKLDIFLNQLYYGIHGYELVVNTMNHYKIVDARGYLRIIPLLKLTEHNMVFLNFEQHNHSLTLLLIQI